MTEYEMVELPVLKWLTGEGLSTFGKPAGGRAFHA